jgi:hypothetical protein
VGTNHLPVLLAGALLLCHGVFGALHLVCDTPRCAGAQHAAEHRPAQAGAATDAHEHAAGHEAGTEYFAVVTGLLGLLLGLLPKGAPVRVGMRARRARVLRRASAVFRPARAPTLLTLQVFRL